MINEGECKYSKNGKLENCYTSALTEQESKESIAKRIVSLFDKNKFYKYTNQEKEDYDIDIWNEAKDNLLKNLVLLYNFDFGKISQIFDKLCEIKKEKDDNGDEIPFFTTQKLRLHWSFLHSRRILNEKTNEEFYIINKRNLKEVENELKQEKNKEKIEEIMYEEKKKLMEFTGIDNHLLGENKRSIDENLEKFYDNLLGQKVSKDTQRLFEMELKQNKDGKRGFPLSFVAKEQRKEEEKWEKLIK